MIRKSTFSIFLVIALCACDQESVYTEIVNGISISEPEWDGDFLVLSVRNRSNFKYCTFEEGVFSGEHVIEGNIQGIELGPAVGSDRIENLRFFNGRDGGNVIEISPGSQAVRIGPISDRDSSNFELAVSFFKCQPEENGRHQSLVYTWSRGP